MKILGIETSCDETAAAVVEDGKRLLSNVVLSSMDLHKAYGGVVPEIAARSHIESIIPVIHEALILSSTTPACERTDLSHPIFPIVNVKGRTFHKNLWDQIDGIAVTYGAGLGGSLLIGVMTARTLAIIKNKPLYAINHVEGHIYANFLTCTGPLSPASERSPELRESSLDDAALRVPLLSRSSTTTAPSATRSRLASSESPAHVKNWKLGGQMYKLPSRQPKFPMLGLIVSGGHSQLVLWRDHFDYTLLGQTHDDAIGEAFDKVAKMLGLPYPGGPSIGVAAKKGDPHAYHFPKAKMSGRYDFSFSGIKTAVLRAAQEQIGEGFEFPSFKLSERLSEAQKANIAASFQRVAIETVVDKTVMAYEEFKPQSVVIGGGVAASPELRRQLADRLPLPIEYTDPKLCTDNGAMIAALGCYKATLDQPKADPYSLAIEPNLSM